MAKIREHILARDKVFISYSHRDKKWLDKVKIHLKPYVQSILLEIWDDSQILPGTNWREQIEKALKSANIALLLVSPNFLSSDFINEYELPPLLNAAEKEGVAIAWIPVSASAFEETAIGQYQALHDPTRPLDKLSRAEQNDALVKICKKIKSIWANCQTGKTKSIVEESDTEIFNEYVERILREIALHTIFSPLQPDFARSPLEMIKEISGREDLTGIMARIPSIANLEEQIRFVQQHQFAAKYAGSWADNEVQLIGVRILQDIETYLKTSCRVYDAGCGSYGQYKAILSVLGKEFRDRGIYWAQDYNSDWYSLFENISAKEKKFLNKPLPYVEGENFDLVACAHVFQDMASNPIAIYATIFSFNKLLKMNGICYITVPYKDSQRGMLDVIETAAYDGGFNVLSIGHRRLVIRRVIERHDPIGITTFGHVILRKNRNIEGKEWNNLLGTSFLRWQTMNLARKFKFATDTDVNDKLRLIERDLTEVLAERSLSVRTFRWAINRLFADQQLWKDAIGQRSKSDIASKIRKYIHKLHDAYTIIPQSTLEIEETCAKYFFWLLLWLFRNHQPINKQVILSTINPAVEETLKTPRDIRVHIDNLSKDQIARLIRHLFEFCELNRVNVRQVFDQYILVAKSID
jgi:SAM-dependent methyltransferase